MDIPRTNVGGSNRGPGACPKRLRVYQRLSGAATDGRPKPAHQAKARKSQKCTGPAGSSRQADCLITTYAYLDGMTVHFPFQNTYAALPDGFFARVAPTPVASPRLIKLNRPLATRLGLDP